MENLASDLPIVSNLNNFNDFICQFGNKLFIGNEIMNYIIAKFHIILVLLL